MPYTQWTWSAAHGRYYMYKLGDDGVILETFWHDASSDRQEQYSTPQSSTYGYQRSQESRVGNVEHTQYASYHQQAFAPASSGGLQSNTNSYQRPFNDTGHGLDYGGGLNADYCMIPREFHGGFFVPGRVFSMMWTEVDNAGATFPGYSTGYSEIRNFIVVRNQGAFSQCIPIRTYQGRGATKPGLIMGNHGVIFTGSGPPTLLPGEYFDKPPVYVRSRDPNALRPESRIDYGTSYAVEHNVKVRDIGTIDDSDLHRVISYHRQAAGPTLWANGLGT